MVPALWEDFMNLIFRKLNPDDSWDLQQFSELMDDLSRRAEDPELLIRNIRRVNAREDAYLMVAQDTQSGRLLGSLLAVTIEDFCGSCSPILLLENVVTRKSCQRQGIGRSMFQEIEAWARRRGVGYIILGSAMHRLEAHRFYSSLGYEEIKGFKKYL
jgi:GNAT superfamily N-acetyltransferase